MSATIIDMPKVTQMLDNGWHIRLYRGGLGTYTAVGYHYSGKVRARLTEIMDDDGSEEITTDDFTPEQALTRLAYKVHGENL